ncbi:hypothetical protein OG21DRAFT_1595447 [Imleria badia]|nr:hypothetical protein OG21DRAFT_1595447 [Imleria badia]
MAVGLVADFRSCNCTSLVRPWIPTRRTPLLDPSLYALGTESLAFFKSTTGIHDDDELKEHILNVQAQAYAVAPYPCIRSFNFTRLKISKMPAYKDVLKLGKEREGALLLDIGCCFGNDARKAALDGFPAKQIVASDLRRELWDLGHVLFRSSPESFPATFVAGDILDPAFLSPFTSGMEPLTEVNLSNISTLNDLRGKVSAIWATAFFHLFSEKKQCQLAHALGSLLSPESGSIIFGSHVALPNKCVLTEKISDKDVRMFCHDPDSWKEMWVGSTAQSITGVDPADDAGGLDAAVFAPNSVKLASTLIPVKSEAGESGLWLLVWSITRV